MSNLKRVRDELAALRQAIKATRVAITSGVGEQGVDPRRLARCIALMISRLANEEREG